MKNRSFLWVVAILLTAIHSIAQVKEVRNKNGSLSITVKIGTQTWDPVNLNVSTFRNGDIIIQAKTNEEWKKAGEEGKPAWCNYDNADSNDSKYGKLYNWYAINDPRGLAPKGWHIPGKAEWKMLTDSSGGETGAGKKLKENTGWNDNGNGTNESGFAADPGGIRNGDGSFDFLGGLGYWWSATENETGTAWSFCLISLDSTVDRSYYFKVSGMSVRCLRD